MEYAVITTKGKKQFSLSSDFAPNGSYHWDEKNDFIQKIPLVIEVTDSWGNKKKVSENWPQLLLDNYDALELVGMESGGPAVVQPRKRGRPTKRKEINQ